MTRAAIAAALLVYATAISAPEPPAVVYVVPERPATVETAKPAQVDRTVWI